MNRKNGLIGSPWETEQELMEDLIKEWENMKTIGIQRGILTKNPDGSVTGRGHPDKLFDEVEKTLNVKNSRRNY